MERVLDSLFLKLNIDIKFTKHFFDRINDDRNKEQITLCEISSIFTSLYRKYGLHLKEIGMSHKEIEEIIKSKSTNINIPFVLKWDRNKNQIVLVLKTIMRKKNFKDRNKELHVESFKEFLINERLFRDKKLLSKLKTKIKEAELTIQKNRIKKLIDSVIAIYKSDIQDTFDDSDIVNYEIVMEPKEYKIAALLQKLYKNKQEETFVKSIYNFLKANEFFGFDNINKTKKLLYTLMNIKGVI